MGYYEVTVIVEGAVDRSETIETERVVNLFIDEVENEAKLDGKETDVFIQFHDHSLSVDDCVCAQYKLSGKADYTFK